MLRGQRLGHGHDPDKRAPSILQTHLTRWPWHQVGVGRSWLISQPPRLALLQHGGAMCGGGGVVQRGTGPGPHQHSPVHAVHHQLLQSHADPTSQWTHTHYPSHSTGAVSFSQTANNCPTTDDAELSTDASHDDPGTECHQSTVHFHELGKVHEQSLASVVTTGTSCASFLGKSE